MGDTSGPLSIGQRLLWLLDRYRGGEGALNCPVLLRLRGPLDTGLLRRALDQLSGRHAMLRTTFAESKRRITQHVHPEEPMPLTHIDLSTASVPDAATAKAIAIDLRTRIDPMAWPVRATLWRTRETDHVLCINMHHLITDAWSCGLLFRDFCRLFQRDSSSTELPTVGWEYSDFVTWEQRWLADGSWLRHREYWHRQLLGTTLPSLPLDSGAGGPRETAKETAEIGPETSEALRRLARARRTTLFTVMLSIYYVLLHQLTDDADLAVASLFANRMRQEVHETVGFFANMVVLRTRLPRAATFTDLIREVHATVAGAILHQSLPHQMLPLGTIPAGTRRVDDVVFQMLAEPMSGARVGDTDVEVLIPDGVGNRFEIETVVIPRQRNLRIVLFYNRGRLRHEWARGFAGRYAVLAAAAVARPDVPLAGLAP